MRDQLATIINSKQWERGIIILIVVNAITLGMETSPTIMGLIGPQLLIFDKIVLGIFVVEICLRLFVHRLKFFRDPWSLFDFTVVAIALFPTTGPLQVFRALRILRVLRLVSVVPSIRRVISGLFAALPGMGAIFLLLGLVYYVFAVMATKLFGATFPDWFGSIPASLYSLFQIMTLESWSMGIVRPVMAEYPLAWAFFVPFILCTTFTVLNLFIGIIVSAMQRETEDTAQADRELLHEETGALLDEVKALRREVVALKERLPSK